MLVSVAIEQIRKQCGTDWLSLALNQLLSREIRMAGGASIIRKLIVHVEARV